MHAWIDHTEPVLNEFVQALVAFAPGRALAPLGHDEPQLVLSPRTARPTAPLDFDLAAWPVTTLQVLDASGGPPAAARCVLQPMALDSDTPPVVVPTDRAGRVRLRLEPGEWFVFATDAEGFAAVTLVVKAGAAPITTTMRLQPLLRRGGRSHGAEALAPLPAEVSACAPRRAGCRPGQGPACWTQRARESPAILRFASLTMPTPPCSRLLAFASGLASCLSGLVAQGSPLASSLQWAPGQGLPGALDGEATAEWDPDGPGPAPAVLVVAGFHLARGNQPANYIHLWRAGVWSTLPCPIAGSVAYVQALLPSRTGNS